MTWDKAKWQQLIERAASGMFCPKVVAKAWSDVTVGSYIYCRYIYIYIYIFRYSYCNSTWFGRPQM